MASQGHARMVIGVAASIAVAGYLAVELSAPVSTASAEEPAKTPKNTGSPAGPAFLLDFTKKQDRGSHYLADYEMDEDWIKIAFRSSNISFGKEGMTLSMLRTRTGQAAGGRRRIPAQRNLRIRPLRSGDEGRRRIRRHFLLPDLHLVGISAIRTTRSTSSSSARARGTCISIISRMATTLRQYVPLWFDTGMSDHLYAFEWAPDSIRLVCRWRESPRGQRDAGQDPRFDPELCDGGLLGRQRMDQSGKSARHASRRRS